MCMNIEILVSVVVPCFNNGKYLKELIDCFERQTVEYWELNIVDDGSTDDTIEVISDYIKDFTNIHLYQRDRAPKNGDTCRNIGFERSVGKYVIFVDADDLISNTFVQYRAEFMESHPYLDYASFPSKAFTDANNLPTIEGEGYVYGIDKGQIDYIPEILRGYSYPFGVWSNIYKKESLIRSQINWDEKLFVYQDFDFLLSGLLAGLRHAFWDGNEVDYYYRQLLNENHVCGHFATQRKVDSTNYLFEKVVSELEKYHLLEAYKQDFLDFILLHFERLVNDECSKDNMSKFTNLCIKLYGKKYSFRFLAKTVAIKNKRIRRLLFVMCCSLNFGVDRYKESLKRQFKIFNK